MSRHDFLEAADKVVKTLSEAKALKVSCPVCAARVGEKCDSPSPHVARSKKGNRT